jgi:hypothetical protein
MMLLCGQQLEVELQKSQAFSCESCCSQYCMVEESRPWIFYCYITGP